MADSFGMNLMNRQISICLNQIAFHRRVFDRSQFWSTTFSYTEGGIRHQMSYKNLKKAATNANPFIKWVEAIQDAVSNKYVRALLFSICYHTGTHGTQDETYLFEFDYDLKETTYEWDPQQLYAHIISKKQTLHMLTKFVEVISSTEPFSEDKCLTFRMFYNDSCPVNYRPENFKHTDHFITPDVDKLLTSKLFTVSMFLGISPAVIVDPMEAVVFLHSPGPNKIPELGFEVELPQHCPQQDDPVCKTMPSDPLGLKVFLTTQKTSNLPDTQMIDLDAISLDSQSTTSTVNECDLGSPSPSHTNCQVCQREIDVVHYGFLVSPTSPMSCYMCVFNQITLEFDLILLMKIRQLWQYLVSKRQIPSFIEMCRFLDLDLGTDKDRLMAASIFNKLFDDRLLVLSEHPCYKVQSNEYEPGCGEFCPTISGIFQPKLGVNIELVPGKTCYVVFDPIYCLIFGMTVNSRLREIYFPYCRGKVTVNLKKNFNEFKVSLSASLMEISRSQFVVTKVSHQRAESTPSTQVTNSMDLTSISENTMRGLTFEQSLAYLQTSQDFSTRTNG